jgi:hypothetical protein
MSALGVDIGGVITDRVNDHTDTSFFGEDFLRTTAVPGAFAALATLVDEVFGDAVFVVSKCGPRVQQKSLAWLAHHRFYERTGVRADHVRFCRRRADKAAIAAELDLTHFVDDRLDVLEPMVGAVGHLYLFQPAERDRRRSERGGEIRVVDSWPEVVSNVLGR